MTPVSGFRSLPKPWGMAVATVCASTLAGFVVGLVLAGMVVVSR